MDNFLTNPNLWDLPQNLTGEVPLNIIQKWVDSDQTEQTQQKILEPYKVTGTMVSSDSSGLSKISKSLPMLEVMQIIHQPKEIIHSHGAAIGGKGIGLWAADNTQMFYEKTIKPEEIIEQMVMAQKEISQINKLTVGIGIHHSEYIKINDFYFGEEAEFIEAYTENMTEGKDIVLTESTTKVIPDHFKKLLHKHNQSAQKEDLYGLNYESLNFSSKKKTDKEYPIPFDSEFYKTIKERNCSEYQTIREISRKYSKENIVILVKILHKKHKKILDQFVEWIRTTSLVSEVLKDYNITKVKLFADLGIFIADSRYETLSFIEDLISTLNDNGVQAKIGISRGEIFLFNLANGTKDLAGDPVNLASKLAEDLGAENEILIHDSIKLPLSNLHNTSKFTHKISGIEIAGEKIIWKK